MASDDEQEPKPANRNKIAVALTYDRARDQAPRVAAKGHGTMAEQILEIARKHDIEIREDADLAGLLEKLDINTPIPLEAYTAVAEILSYIYKMNDKAKKKP